VIPIFPARPNPEIEHLIETVGQFVRNRPVYLVGGAVRDLLLERPCRDLDFALTGDVRPLARRVAKALKGDFFMLDDERNTARVIAALPGGRFYLDFATLRGENIEQDLNGRDFSVNAMALELPQLERLIDPCNGAGDLQAKRLRPCSPGAFRDDPVRILRGVRLSVGFQFELEKQTLEAMAQAVPGLEKVSSERQRDELFHMLEGQDVRQAVEELDRLGVLERLLPELPGMKGVTQGSPHIHDVWSHTLALLQELEDVFEVLAEGYNKDGEVRPEIGAAREKLERFRPRIGEHFRQQLNPERSLGGLLFFSALYHDIAKPATRLLEADGRIHFLRHEAEGARAAAQRAQALALSQAEVVRVEATVREHMRIHLLAKEDGRPTRRAIYRFFRSAGPAGVEVCLLSLADTLATYGDTLPAETWLAELEVCRILMEAWWENPSEVVNPPRLVSGDDLLQQFHLQPGPTIGELLAAIREAQAGGDVTDRQQALAFADDWLERKGKS
jgi:poly(A) polymerase